MTRQTARRPQRSSAFSGQSACPVVFIECTNTYSTGLNTGIQRAVRNIVRHAISVGARHGFEVVPVVFRRKDFVPVDVEDLLSGKAARGVGENETESGPAAHSVDLRKLKREASRVVEQIVKMCRRLHAYVGPRARTPGNILLLLDSSWHLDMWTAVRDFRRSGGYVIGVIHDLVPIAHGHTTVNNLRHDFQRWLEHLAHQAAGAVCVSKFVADSLTDYLAADGQRGVDVPPLPIKYFYHGSGLDLAETDGVAQESIARIFDRQSHIFLMVGSIEPRKNHAFVLNAFEQFWRQGGVGALVIVGNQSWLMEEFLTRVASHPQLGKQLFLVRDATDTDLAYCYTNASALIFASQIEGFGLPIVEAFQYGLRVFCSDIPVFREIADGKATFFALDGRDDLVRRIADFCAAVDPCDRAQRHPQPWIGWEQSAEQLFAAMLACVGQAGQLSERK